MISNRQSTAKAAQVMQLRCDIMPICDRK